MLHTDIAIIGAGDFTPVDGISAEEKNRLEKESVLNALSGLPNSADYLAVWEEYAKAQSPEARFVRQVDRPEMGLQAVIYEVQGLLETDEFLQSAGRAQQSEPLQAIIAELFRLREQEV